MKQDKTTYPNGRLFQNSILEKLTRTNVVYPISIFFSSSLGVLIYVTTTFNLKPGFILLSLFSGLFFWTFFEYIVHRFLFHIPPYNNFWKRFQYTVHGVHHEFPRDKTRVAMPPILSVLLASFFFFIYWLILGNYGLVLGSGFIAGYGIYLIIHYSTHARKAPQNKLRMLWLYHNWHHYRENSKAFGVSSPLWDYVFRTLPSKQLK